MDEVRHRALQAALQLKPSYGYDNVMGRNLPPSVSSILDDAKKIEEYLRGAPKPNGKTKKK